MHNACKGVHLTFECGVGVTRVNFDRALLLDSQNPYQKLSTQIFILSLKLSTRQKIPTQNYPRFICFCKQNVMKFKLIFWPKICPNFEIWPKNFDLKYAPTTSKTMTRICGPSCQWQNLSYNPRFKWNNRYAWYNISFVKFLVCFHFL